MDIDPDRVLSSPFTVGGFGAIVALKFAPGGSWWERVTNVASGALASGYMAPALVDWLQLKTPGLANASAFVIGLLGMSLIAALLEGIRNLKLAEILQGWLARR